MELETISFCLNIKIENIKTANGTNFANVSIIREDNGIVKDVWEEEAMKTFVSNPSENVESFDLVVIEDLFNKAQRRLDQFKQSVMNQRITY